MTTFLRKAGCRGAGARHLPAADLQDRDGGVLLMASLFGLFPFLRKLYAAGGCQGPAFRKALARVLPRIDVEIVKRSDGAQGLERCCPGAGSSSARLHPPHAAKTLQPLAQIDGVYPTVLILAATVDEIAPG